MLVIIFGCVSILHVDLVMTLGESVTRQQGPLPTETPVPTNLEEDEGLPLDPPKKLRLGSL
ncbi:MAG TPA: hypothetical protein P5280_16745 [Cyclobacteriaceae bacterium]|nr:hypothetical protein [Cyclobacteriaceae bacterium]